MPDRKVAPSLHEVNDIQIPKVSTTKLSNGNSVHYINAGTQPVCKIEIIIHAGKWHETKPGVSWLSCKMLQEGTSTLSSLQISEKIDQSGSYLGIDPGMKFSSMEVYFLKEVAGEIIPLLSQLIFDSVIPQSELDNQMQILTQNLKIELKKNDVVASRLLRQNLFGKNHPYGSFVEPGNIESIIREDVIEFYEKKILQSKIDILASGHIDDEILRLLEIHLGSKPAKSELDGPSFTSEASFEKVLIEKDESTQTSIRIGGFCLKKTDPDFHKLLIANEILGGYFGSRLMQNIRETKGLTYGIYSQINANNYLGYFTIGADARKELRDVVVEEVIKEVDLLAKDGVSQEELTRVRNYLFGEFLGEINTPFNLAGKFKSILLNSQGYEYYDQYFETLRNIRSEDVQEMCTKYFKTPHLSIVGVG